MSVGHKDQTHYEPIVDHHTNSDTAWKEILDAYFPDFVIYCLPELNALIDWNLGCESLDKELHAITKDSITGSRLVDKLFKVFLKNGQEQWILVHIEVQGKPDKHFQQRMFTYAYRLFDKYQMPVVSCAILTDDNKKWRPNRYEIGLMDSKLSHEFIVVKLIDYQNRYAELEASRNPFASVILCSLEALASKKQPGEERLNIKMNLTRRLYKKAFDKTAIKNLYLFIDWLITLSEPLEIEYKNHLHQLEESTNMAYVSTIERMGRQEGYAQGISQGILRGKQEGLQEGEALLLGRLLTRKFGPLPTHYRKLITEADSDTLLEWSDRFLIAKTLEEIFK